jgi:hypothetical protein
MVPTYNGWEDPPEDEREALEQWELRERAAGRGSRAMPRLSGTEYAARLSGRWGVEQ